MGNINRTVGSIADILSGDCGMIASRRNPGVTEGRTVATAIACLLAVLIAAPGAHAGSSTYDLNPMLDEQHPFARAQIPAFVSYSPRTTSSLIPSAPAPKPAKGDTLVGLLGLSTASKTPPAQVANSFPAAASAPQVAAAGEPRVRNGDPSFITINGGWYDIFHHEQAAEFTAEYRSNQMFWMFKPFAGVMFTSDAAFYGFGGFLSDFYFGRRIVVSPSIAAGLYLDGDGKDLGSNIEFRSGLEIGWRFDNRSRLSAMIYHISNASIGDRNPGTEFVSLGYSFPLE